MTNKEKAIEIIDKAEQNHINLYHDISKEDFKIELDKFLCIADSLSDKAFDYEMLKLFALFKDAHTSYYIPYKCFDKKIYYIENKVLLKDGDNFKEIIKVKDMNIDDVIRYVSSMQNYETNEFLTTSLRWELNNLYVYDMLNLVNDDYSLDFIVKDNNKQEIINVKHITVEEYKALGLFPVLPYYSYRIINDIIIIEYKRCKEHEDYPFIKFVEEIKKEIEDKNITKYILDLRGNSGGDSSIINPLTEMIQEISLEGVLLIDNGVFSSGRWAIADFKKAVNPIMIGEPTGGAAASYGYTKNLSVEDKRFSVSIRYWDFSKVFGYSGSIQPDIFVPTTLKDLQENIDSQLNSALEYLKTNKKSMEQEYDEG